MHELVAAGLGRHAAEILAHARTSLLITPTRSEQSAVATGASRFGGVPDLPDSIQWPTHRGSPLTCLAQLDLAALPASELPPSGTLAFFYDLHTLPRDDAEPRSPATDPELRAGGLRAHESAVPAHSPRSRRGTSERT